MTNKERNKTDSLTHSINLVFFFAFLGFRSIFSFAQVDTCLESLNLSDFKHAFDLRNLKTIPEEFVKNHDVIPFGTLFLDRLENGWAYEADSCLFDNNSARFLDSFDIGTKLIYCGLAMSPAIQRRKGFRSVSFKLPEQLSLNDTLHFSFITLADGIGGFQPSIYFSKKVKFVKTEFYVPLLKNGSYLKYAQKMPNRSMDDRDLTHSTFELIITKKLKNLKWIHLVNDYYGDEGGYIVSSCHTITSRKVDVPTYDSIESFSERIYFDNDSYEITKDQLSKLYLIIEQYNMSKERKISVSAFADKSGNREQNLLLASNRANAVVEFLIEKGVSRSKIHIENLTIGNFGSQEKNRVCLIKITR